MHPYGSWGRYPSSTADEVISVSAGEPLPRHKKLLLPYGLGRSYGDVCANQGHILLDTSGLNTPFDLDEQGVLHIGAGVTFKQILEVIIPRGWFLPVTPGTQFVTVGGAIANDVHGKNHHRAGTFGGHVERFELLRSDGLRRVCSRHENDELFRSTIGGLGLTGLITWADIRLQPIANAWITSESIPFVGLDAFLALSQDSDLTHEYCVSWIDTGSSAHAIRGIFMRGNHAAHASALGPENERPVARERTITVPYDAPSFLINPLTVKLFNIAYYQAQRFTAGKKTVHYRPFFYPLDGLLNWNRLYGARGFLEYQCVIPFAAAKEVLQEILRLSFLSKATTGLSVLKTFGDRPSDGLLSFPMKGVTLALDFYRKNNLSLDLFETFDQMVLSAGGRVYPAKDARMSAATFQKQFPNLERFKQSVDPAFSSDFWRRVVS